MEIIPVLSRLNGIEARLQNPSFISKILQNFTGGITDNISQISNFWTLGALIIAFIATFTKFKLILIRLQKISRKLLLISSSPPSSYLQPSISSDVDDEDDDETCSSSGSSISSLSDFDSEEEEYRTNDDDQDDFRVAGSSNYEEVRGHSFTWSDFANRGKNVVKSWPEGLNLGLGLGLDNSSCSSLVSMLDYGINSSNFGSSSSFFGQSMLSPAVIVSAGLIENSKNVALKVWDTRVGRHIPEIIAEWQPCWKRVLSNGCLNNNSVDLRNVRAPVNDHQSITQWINFEESDIIDGDLHDIGKYLAGTNDSVLSRCLSAYFTL